MEFVSEKPNFASRFREVCGVSDLNVLAETFNVTKNTFRQWANGYCTPTVEKLIKLSEHFNVSTDYLLGLSDIKTRDEDVITASKITRLSELAVSSLKTSYIDLDVGVNALLESESGKIFLAYLVKTLEIARNRVKYEDTDIVAIDTTVKTKDKMSMFVNSDLSFGNYYEELQNYCLLYMTNTLRSLIKSVEDETEMNTNDNKKGKRK